MERMSIEARKARNLYLREWRKKNPEKDREYKARYWARIAERKAAEKQQSQEQGAKE